MASLWFCMTQWHHHNVPAIYWNCDLFPYRHIKCYTCISIILIVIALVVPLYHDAVFLSVGLRRLHLWETCLWVSYWRPVTNIIFDQNGCRGSLYQYTKNPIEICDYCNNFVRWFRRYIHDHGKQSKPTKNWLVPSLMNIIMFQVPVPYRDGTQRQEQCSHFWNNLSSIEISVILTSVLLITKQHHVKWPVGIRWPLMAR